ncbi:MAG: 2-oxoacid:acceptor oxidoreductase family protein [Candidatus Brocadiae bacterium]|nr:2-oxoacid:acceptor oxidoreductase family protein [Candidatus Brocadiia bacterium]
MQPNEQAAPAATTDQEHRLIIAGFGGQGVLTIAKLLCTTAMSEGKNVTYLPSYGAEVRGGTANCQVVVSSGVIYSPLVEQADSLIILNQLSCDRFVVRLKPGGLLVLNSSAVALDDASQTGARQVLRLPAADTAARIGNVKVTNSVMLGAFVRASGLVAEEDCLAALREHWSRRRAEVIDPNVTAFRRGVELAAEA